MNQTGSVRFALDRFGSRIQDAGPRAKVKRRRTREKERIVKSDGAWISGD